MVAQTYKFSTVGTGGVERAEAAVSWELALQLLWLKQHVPGLARDHASKELSLYRETIVGPAQLEDSE